MTKLEKLEDKIRDNPKSVAFNDLVRLLESYGFVSKRSKGSHHQYTCGEERLTIVAPHGKKGSMEVATYQVKQALEAIDRIIDNKRED